MGWALVQTASTSRYKYVASRYVMSAVVAGYLQMYSSGTKHIVNG